VTRPFRTLASAFLVGAIVVGALWASTKLGAEKRYSPIIRNAHRLIVQDPLKEGELIRITSLAQGRDATVNLVRTTGALKKHYHADHEEIVYIIHGGGTMTMGDKQKRVRPGDVIYIPRKTIHGFVNGGEWETAVLSVISPAFDGKDRVYVE